MRKLILSMLGVAGIFLATNVYAVGTATVKFDTATITTLTTTTNTTTTDNITNAAITHGTVTGNFNVQGTFRINGSDTTKAASFTDNQGSKMDSGALLIVSGSQTVTTSLTACDRPFFSISASGSPTANIEYIVTTSGAGFTIQGYYGSSTDLNLSTLYVGTASGHWFAIDE